MFVATENFLVFNLIKITLRMVTFVVITKIKATFAQLDAKNLAKVNHHFVKHPEETSPRAVSPYQVYFLKCYGKSRSD